METVVENPEKNKEKDIFILIVHLRKQALSQIPRAIVEFLLVKNKSK